ncbi:hypothetical protein BESB_070520 [Besnoitia besnoiti]|uniref:Clathrin/coatomer adaptor adaptin-like N-terminal domain-containing protein n=1 Tax=Besnoitia besnoiti TaxID=94643 RepID=A0A2A9MEV2_BESBE|nr:uncharacterized protein BESB_070520 [Besnoitia besnoiti]PFH33900.1 hypothetical protein BESB_070520 [Besnoitia besnoiti]
MFNSRTSLPSLIRGLRAAQQEGTEEEYLSQCLQQIKEDLLPGSASSSQAISSILGRTPPTASERSTALMKLIYLQMLGFDTGFATFAIVQGMSVQSFTLKRPAYAACALAFARPLARASETDASEGGEQPRREGRRNLAEEKQQQQQALSLLTTNLFKKDFNSKETHETGLALSTLAAMSTPEIAQALIPDVLLLLSSSRSILRKKAAVCCTRFLIQVPALLPSSFSKLRQQLMAEEDASVVSCLCSALLQLVHEKPQQYLSLAPPLYHLLCNSTSNWLSLKLLKVFALLCPHEPRLPLKLLQPLAALLQQSRAKSVEVEILRLALFHFPLDDAAAKAAAAARAGPHSAFLLGGATAEAGGDASRDEARGESAAEELLHTCLSRTLALLTSADRNLRYVGVDILAKLFAKKRKFARDVAALIPDFQKYVLQAAEECDATIRSRGIDLLTKTATPASFPAIAEQLVAAAATQEENYQRKLARQAAKPEQAAEGGRYEASVLASAGAVRAGFLLPLLKMGAENHYALVEDFEWYLALLGDIAVRGGGAESGAGRAAGAHGEEEGPEAAVAQLVAEQLLDVAVRVPGVRPCAAHLCSLICDRAAASLCGASLPPSAGSTSLRRPHEAYLQLAGALRAEEDAMPHGSQAAPHVSPVIVRASAWIVGEYFECMNQRDGDDAAAQEQRKEGPLAFYCDACRSLLRLTRSLALPAPVQQVVISAAVKVFLGACNAAAGADTADWSAEGRAVKGPADRERTLARLRDLQEEMQAMLALCRAAAEGESSSCPSHSVEVFDRVRLAEQLVQFFGPGDLGASRPTAPGLPVWGLEQGSLLPVLSDAQQRVPLDASLDLSKPFFDYRRLQQSPLGPAGAAAQASPTAAQGLWASGSDPAGAAGEVSPLGGAGALRAPGENGTVPAAGLGLGAASGAPKKKKFEVIREAIAPSQTATSPQAAAVQGARPGSSLSALQTVSRTQGADRDALAASLQSAEIRGGADGARGGEGRGERRDGKCLFPAESALEAGLPVPLAMQLQLRARLWQCCAKDQALRVFACVGEALGPTAPDEPPALSLALCCERAFEEEPTAQAEVVEVALAVRDAGELRLPAQIPLAADVKKRSPRVVVKPASFASPLCCTSTVELRDWEIEGHILYKAVAEPSAAAGFSLLDGDSNPGDGDASLQLSHQERSTRFAIQIPATVALLPLHLTEDQLASFLAREAGSISVQHSDRLSVRPRSLGSAAGADTWSICLRGEVSSPLAALQYLRVVACLANMSLLPQQPLPSSAGAGGVLKCLLVARLYTPDAAHELQRKLEKIEAGELAESSVAALQSGLGAGVDGRGVVVAFIACASSADPGGEGENAALQFRVNTRSASAACSEAVCRQLCRLIEETVAGRLHVFTE